jgi:hypothetical protein
MNPERPEQSSDESKRHQATVLVRGETIHDGEMTSPKQSAPEESTAQESTAQESERKDSAPKNGAPEDKGTPRRKEISEAKVREQSHLPVLDDDADVGVQKEHIVTRDGKADLSFTGTLLASAAPPSAPHGHWQEYRVYATDGGKHVFSKVARSIFAEEADTHEAEVFDPSPSSMPSQLLRSARDLARARPLTWTDAAAAFFGYDPLAKVLYRKLSGQFEEHIS